MLDIEYNILKFISANRSCRWTDVVNAFNPETKCNFVSQLLLCMVSDGLIEVFDGKPPECYIRACSVSARYLAEYESQRAEEAEQKWEKEMAEKRKRRDAIIDRLTSAAIALASAVVGAVVSFFLSA